MSNPGVVLLAESIIDGQVFKIEDNIGEAIHIHWGNSRIDLTIKEFVSLVKICKNIVEKMVDVDGFSFDLYDAIFLSQRCSELINLEKIEFSDVKISDMLMDQHDEKGFRTYVPLKEGRVSKAINGDVSELINWKQINYYGLDNISRLEDIQKKIKSNGYDPQVHGSYIVLDGTANVVIDGCHRTSVLYDEQGDVEVRVAKWFYKNEERDAQTIIRDYMDSYNDQIEKCINTINNKKKLVKCLLEHELVGKRVLLKGAGVHSIELLKIIDRNVVNIVGIQDNKLMQGNWNDIPVMAKSEISKENVDVILISSYHYRQEMKEEMSCYQKIDIYDIYDNGINNEFFSEW